MTIKWRVLLFSLSVALVLAACGLAEGPIPTPRPPTITPTKISTPLPYLTPPPPAGASADNPIQVVIVPADAATAAQRLGEFESALQTLTNVSVSVGLADTDDDAYDLVCAADQGIVAVAWLEGMSYVANSLANCGIGTLQAQTETGTGETGVMLRSLFVAEDAEDDDTEDEPAEGTVADAQQEQDEQETENPDLVASAEGIICRLGVDDLFSWTLPVLYYGSEGITPADLVSVVDVADNDALIAALQTGECDAAGMSQADWDAYLEADEEGTLSDLVEVVYTSPEIPYNVMSFSSALSINAVEDIEDAFLQMEFATGRSEPTAEATEDPDVSLPSTFDSTLLEAFFGDAVLVQVDEDRLNALFNLFSATSFEFSELGD